MTNPTLNLVVLRSADLAKAHAFYAALGLHFKQHQHGNGPLHYACDLGGAVVELYPRRNDHDATSATRIGFAVGALDETITAATSHGGRLVTAAHSSPWGRRAVLAAPDEHRVELVERS